jgi:hypothetical protein
MIMTAWKSPVKPIAEFSTSTGPCGASSVQASSAIVAWAISLSLSS